MLTKCQTPASYKIALMLFESVTMPLDEEKNTNENRKKKKKNRGI